MVLSINDPPVYGDIENMMSSDFIDFVQPIQRYVVILYRCKLSWNITAFAVERNVLQGDAFITYCVL